jgi:ABC-type transport system substrate-binding protein
MTTSDDVFTLVDLFLLVKISRPLRRALCWCIPKPTPRFHATLSSDFHSSGARLRRHTTAGGSNTAKWCCQPYGDLVVKAKSVSNQDECAKLYHPAPVIFKDQMPRYAIAHAAQLKPKRQEVIDYKLSALRRHTICGVEIKE